MKPATAQRIFMFCVLYGTLASTHLGAQENLYRIVSPSGQTVKFVEYDNAYDFAHGLAPVKLGDFWGYIDAEGTPAIPRDKPFYFDAAEEFGKHGLALVWAKGRYKFINTAGEDAIPQQFEEAYGFGEYKAAVVKVNYKWGLIDLKGNFLIPPKYEGINSYENLATVYDGEKFALFDINGNALTPFIYENIGIQQGLMFEDRIPVRQNNRWGFIDGKGKSVIPLQYEEVGRFSEGLVGYIENNKAGYLDQNGKVIVAPVYASADQFSEGLASVMQDNLWGYIDKKGALVIPFVYAGAGRFTEGKAYVVKGDNYFYIDKTGKRLAEPAVSQTSAETPKLSLKAVDEKMNVSLTYPSLGIRVDKFWEAYGGTATNGKVYDLQTNRLIGEEVVFDKGKITKGKFYAEGRTLSLSNSAGILLADLGKTIAEEAAKLQTATPAQATPSKDENEKFIALYTELNALYLRADDEYMTYYFKAVEFDMDASNDAERKANLYKKIKPYQDIIEAIVDKTQYLLKNDPYMLPKTREVLSASIPKYQAKLDKLRSL